jgi:hypothetical protein
MTTLVQRHFFSITDVVSALLPDGPVDCERFEFRVNAGMLELDVVGQAYPQGMPKFSFPASYIGGFDFSSPQGICDCIMRHHPGAVISMTAEGNLLVNLARPTEEDLTRRPHTAALPEEICLPEDDSPPWEEVDAAPAIEPLKGGPIAKKAGILCAKPLFWTFLKVRTEEAATNVLRRECGVQSRAELDHNEAAAKAFDRLNTEFVLWDSPQ